MTRLAQRAYENDLEAAHAEELIADGTPATAEVQAALTAAVYHGIASGLRDAIDLLRDGRAGPSETRSRPDESTLHGPPSVGSGFIPGCWPTRACSRPCRDRSKRFRCSATL